MAASDGCEVGLMVPIVSIVGLVVNPLVGANDVVGGEDAVGW